VTEHAEDPQPVAARAAEVVERMRVVPPRPEARRPSPVDKDELAEWQHLQLEERRQLGWGRAIPSRFVHAELAHFVDQRDVVRDGLADWAGAHGGRNLLLLGPVGVGKSHAAVAACREHHHRGAEVVFLPVVELLDQLRPGGPEGAMENLAHADLLVLDDLGSERATDWTAERLYALVNRRWLEERPIVATTNLEPDPLKEALGERVFSRLVHDAVVVRLTGKDRRRRHA
jgi:DNA replication protein DnaC